MPHGHQDDDGATPKNHAGACVCYVDMTARFFLAVPAGLGVAAGAIALDCDRAQALARAQPVVLVRPDLTTDDVAGLAASMGVLTAHGGRTSHAAVVARHLGKVCLVGCSSLQIDLAGRRCSFGPRSFAEGDVIALDGESGLVYAGAVPAVAERPEAALSEVATWRVQRPREQSLGSLDVGVAPP
jgi:pyruvate,orthophosphate dikinase